MLDPHSLVMWSCRICGATAACLGVAACSEAVQGSGLHSTGVVPSSDSRSVLGFSSHDGIGDTRGFGVEVSLPGHCTSETCDGIDNDCDGQVDEDVCNDGDPCTVPWCNTLQHACLYKSKSEGDECDDGDACTVVDVCVKQGCPGNCTLTCKGNVKCKDSTACASAKCEPASGTCLQSPINEGIACDDGNPCTSGDACYDGACVAAAKPCDDENPCTQDGCDQTGACIHEPAGGPCDDGNACTQGDVCMNGACTGGGPKACDDGNPCTDDACVKPDGCVAQANAAICDDFDACTTGDVCNSGKCQGSKPTPCDDENLCTQDGCDAAGGCYAKPQSGPCSDDDACTLDDTCLNGACSGLAPKKCDDFLPCTNDSCDPKQGCTHAFNQAPCNDNNNCTKSDVCAFGACAGAPLDCSSWSGACTSGGCFSGVCKSQPVLNGKACDDGNKCTVSDSCASGTCTGNGSLNCNDGNVCTTDTCTPASGCVHNSEIASCNDSDQCTTADKCTGGICKGTPVTCNDYNACTQDWCEKPTGCKHSTPPPEVCNGKDDDCDGIVDEGVKNACLKCGPVPVETCNLKDDDCDGKIDEGLNATWTFINNCVKSKVFLALGGCNACSQSCSGYWLVPGGSVQKVFQQKECFYASAYAATSKGKQCMTLLNGKYDGAVHNVCNGDCLPETFHWQCLPGSE